MPLASHRTRNLKLAAAVAIAGLSLSACATKSYVNEQVDMLSTRINAVDSKADQALQQAQAANSAAQQANTAAQAAATDAQNANQRLDQLTTRVDTLEQNATRRTPRH
jgi:outer membrane murein-binding lipoprotein Lpp